MRVSMLSILVFMSLVGGTRADTIPDAEHKTLESFADGNPSCREWSDGCAVCLRHDDGKFDCSLPGIACQPQASVCRADKQPDVSTIPPK